MTLCKTTQRIITLRNETQHIDTQHEDTKYYGTQYYYCTLNNDTQHIDTLHEDTKHNGTLHIDTQYAPLHKAIQYNDTKHYMLHNDKSSKCQSA
jgi:hypothetical protein